MELVDAAELLGIQMDDLQVGGNTNFQNFIDDWYQYYSRARTKSFYIIFTPRKKIILIPKVGVTKVPRTVLMQKKRRLAADQDAHLDYKDQEQATLDYDAAVKIESADMEEFEEAEENIDINVDQGQAVKIEGSSRKRRQVDHNLPCNVCGKRFPNKRRLEVHAIIHTDKKPYECDQCDRAFNQLANLMTHKKKMHFNQIGTQEIADRDIDGDDHEVNVEMDEAEPSLSTQVEPENEVVQQNTSQPAEETDVQNCEPSSQDVISE